MRSTMLGVCSTNAELDVTECELSSTSADPGGPRRKIPPCPQSGGGSAEADVLDRMNRSLLLDPDFKGPQLGRGPRPGGGLQLHCASRRVALACGCGGAPGVEDLPVRFSAAVGAALDEHRNYSWIKGWEENELHECSDTPLSGARDGEHLGDIVTQGAAPAVRRHHRKAHKHEPGPATPPGAHPCWRRSQQQSFCSAGIACLGAPSAIARRAAVSVRGREMREPPGELGRRQRGQWPGGMSGGAATVSSLVRLTLEGPAAAWRGVPWRQGLCRSGACV